MFKSFAGVKLTNVTKNRSSAELRGKADVVEDDFHDAMFLGCI